MTGALEDYLRKQEQPKHLLPEISGKTIMLQSLQYHLLQGNCAFKELRQVYDRQTSMIRMLRGNDANNQM